MKYNSILDLIGNTPLVKLNKIEKHYSIIGIGTIINNYPLYADAINEHGLAFAALNFPNNAYYYNEDIDKINLAPFELCIYLLCKYKSIKDVNNEDILNIKLKDGLITTKVIDIKEK